MDFCKELPIEHQKKGSKVRWAKFWDAYIWCNFLCQKTLFLAIFSYFLCTKSKKNSLVIQKWLEILGKMGKLALSKKLAQLFKPKNPKVQSPMERPFRLRARNLVTMSVF